MTHPVLDVTDEDYREVLQTAHVGENLHLRVVDLGADRSDNRDRVSVLMQAKSGAKQRVELLETAPHSGVFRASYALSLKVDGDASQVTPLTTDSIRREGFPVLYGDVVAIRYTDGSGVKTPITMIKLNKGANGRVVPFTKRFEDSVVAERTQFSLAESYLELARRHRRLGEEEKANLEYAQAKQLLSNTMKLNSNLLGLHLLRERVLPVMIPVQLFRLVPSGVIIFTLIQMNAVVSPRFHTST